MPLIKRCGAVVIPIILFSTFMPGCSVKTGETIKIGAIYPLTGPQAASGKDIQNGLMLAADIINHKYDIDMPLAETEGIPSLQGASVELVFADSEGLDSTGGLEAKRLIEQEDVVALIGCYQSAVTAAASQVAEDEGIPFISDTSTAPSLTQRGFQWFFRTTPDDTTFVENYFQFLDEIQQKKSTAFNRIGIVAEDSIFGSEFADYVSQFAASEGYQIVDNIAYSSETSNVDNEVSRLESSAPDIIMQASYTQDAILFIQSYKQSGYSPAAILTNDAGFNDPEFINSLRDDANYVYTRDIWSKDWANTDPLANTVNQMFRNRFGTDMTSDSTRAFTGLMVLADAIERAGSTDPSVVLNSLTNTDYPADSLIVPWEGVKFDPQTHQNVMAKGLISQIYHQEHSIVWPENLATLDPEWPMPAWNSRN